MALYIIYVYVCMMCIHYTWICIYVCEGYSPDNLALGVWLACSFSFVRTGSLTDLELLSLARLAFCASASGPQVSTIYYLPSGPQVSTTYFLPSGLVFYMAQGIVTNLCKTLELIFKSVNFWEREGESLTFVPRKCQELHVLRLWVMATLFLGSTSQFCSFFPVVPLLSTLTY